MGNRMRSRVKPDFSSKTLYFAIEIMTSVSCRPIVMDYIDGYFLYELAAYWLLSFLRFWKWNLSWIQACNYSAHFYEEMFFSVVVLHELLWNFEEYLGWLGLIKIYVFIHWLISECDSRPTSPTDFFVATALNQHQVSPFYFLCHFHLDAAVQTVAVKALTPGGDY